MEKKSLETEISSYIGKLLRTNFGKGPASVYVSINEPFVTIYLKDFLVPMERILLKQGNELSIEQTRDLLMVDLLPEIKATLKIKLDTPIPHVYYDWDLEKHSGIFIVELSNGTTNQSGESDYPGKEALHQEVREFSRKAQKAPTSINSYMLNARTLVTVRKNILVKIEEELINAGFVEQLKLAKRRLEKSLVNTKLIESILGKEIEDFFVDWDFNLDKGYVVFILKSNN